MNPTQLLQQLVRQNAELPNRIAEALSRRRAMEVPATPGWQASQQGGSSGGDGRSGAADGNRNLPGGSYRHDPWAPFQGDINEGLDNKKPDLYGTGMGFLSSLIPFLPRPLARLAGKIHHRMASVRNLGNQFNAFDNARKAHLANQQDDEERERRLEFQRTHRLPRVGREWMSSESTENPPPTLLPIPVPDMRLDRPRGSPSQTPVVVSPPPEPPKPLIHGPNYRPRQPPAPKPVPFGPPRVGTQPPRPSDPPTDSSAEAARHGVPGYVNPHMPAPARRPRRKPITRLGSPPPAMPQSPATPPAPKTVPSTGATLPSRLEELASKLPIPQPPPPPKTPSPPTGTPQSRNETLAQAINNPSQQTQEEEKSSRRGGTAGGEKSASEKAVVELRETVKALDATLEKLIQSIDTMAGGLNGPHESGSPGERIPIGDSRTSSTLDVARGA